MSIASSRSVKKLLSCFSQTELTQMAEQLKFTIRQRNINPLSDRCPWRRWELNNSGRFAPQI